jgi:hypothetical protein
MASPAKVMRPEASPIACAAFVHRFMTTWCIWPIQKSNLYPQAQR